MGMKLSELDLIKTLPQWMRDDEADAGLANGINTLIRDLGARVPTLRTWDQIDNLTEEELDELAWEMNIDWYDNEMSIDQKRAVIKSAGTIIKKRGTKYAVMEVVNTAFGAGEVLEWFDYEGDPHHFKIIIDASTATRFDPDYIRKMLDKVKPASAVLDEMDYVLTADFYINEYFTVDVIDIGYKNYIYNLERLDGSKILDGSELMDAAIYFGIDINLGTTSKIPEEFDFESNMQYGGIIPEDMTIDVDLGILFDHGINEGLKHKLNMAAEVQETPLVNTYMLVTEKNYKLLDGNMILDGSDTMNSYRTEEVL